METEIGLAISAIEGLLPLLSGATSGQLQSIINFVDRLLPSLATLEGPILTSVQNIIAAVSGSGAVTTDQVAALQAQSDALNAALDAAAKDDGLTGV